MFYKQLLFESDLSIIKRTDNEYYTYIMWTARQLKGCLLVSFSTVSICEHTALKVNSTAFSFLGVLLSLHLWIILFLIVCNVGVLSTVKKDNLFWMMDWCGCTTTLSSFTDGLIPSVKAIKSVGEKNTDGFTDGSDPSVKQSSVIPISVANSVAN